MYNGHTLYACVCVLLGIAITLQDNSIIECHALLLCSTCDLPAKALVMNMIQFNGFYGCSHCMQKGITSISLLCILYANH